MGVPPKLTKVWQDDVEKYISEFECDVKDLGGEDERIARIAFNQKTMK